MSGLYRQLQNNSNVHFTQSGPTGVICCLCRGEIDTLGVAGPTFKYLKDGEQACIACWIELVTLGVIKQWEKNKANSQQQLKKQLPKPSTGGVGAVIGQSIPSITGCPTQGPIGRSFQGL